MAIIGDFNRHCCPHSEDFVGGDALMTALQEGWQIVNIVTRRKVQFPGARYTFIYVVVLAREHTLARMNVTDNPFVARLVAEVSNQLEARVGSSPIRIVE